MNNNSSLYETPSMKAFISFPILAVALIFSSCALFGNRSKDDANTKKTNSAANDFVPEEVEPKYDKEELESRVKYPEAAKKKGIEGEVIVQFFLDKEGKIRKTRIVQGDPLLVEAAINAIMQTEFTPALQRGKPVGVWMTMPITFSIK
jgi:protein TonB